MNETKMAASWHIDEVLASLASMGFELDECEKAIQAGHTTLEAAIEWLLEKKDHTSPEAKEDENKQNPTPSSSAEQMVDSTVCGSQVTSRYCTSDEIKGAKERFIKKERESARLEAKKRKLNEKKTRELILKQIADDKEMRKAREGLKVTVASSAECSSEKQTDAARHKTEQPVCMLQLRLPSGQVKKVPFTADTKLEEAVLSVCRDSSFRTGEMEIIQPFPHRVFTCQEIASTLMEVGLCPSGSVVVRKLEHTTPTTDITSPSHVSSGNSAEASGEGSAQESDDEGEGRQQQVEEAPLPDDQQHVDADSDDDDDEMHQDIAGPDPVNIFGHHGLPGLGRGQHYWGEGMRLGDVQHNPHAVDPVLHAQSPGESAARRMEMRALWQNRLADVAQEPLDELPQLHREVTRLEELCINNISHRLAGHPHLQPITSLGVLPHVVCDKIINQLIKDKGLTPKTLHAFLSCCLRYIRLDCYLLVTNELLVALRLHRHLTHLSLKSCPIITDKALGAVAALKRLQSLNINQCAQLTDRCFTHIKDLPSLTALQMNNTKVTDTGVCYFMSNASCVKNLIHLSLCSSSITDQSLQALRGLESLRILGLENTKITSIDVVGDLPHLESLNVSYTGISDNSLIALHGHPALMSLSILSTQVTNDGLQHLQGLRLTLLKLPGRLNITDQGIAFIQDLLLVTLDLSDYINVTDVGILYIAGMTSLTKLTLSNTRLTDQGMSYLSGLTQLVELNVGRTVVTDDGCTVIENFPNLQILGLSSTRITNKLLTRGTLNNCTKISQLNLSRTRVSNRGIQHLTLSSLSLLNLDWTRVTADCSILLTGCPFLKALRTKNCTPPSGDGSESDEEQD